MGGDAYCIITVERPECGCNLCNDQRVVRHGSTAPVVPLPSAVLIVRKADRNLSVFVFQKAFVVSTHAHNFISYSPITIGRRSGQPAHTSSYQY